MLTRVNRSLSLSLECFQMNAERNRFCTVESEGAGDITPKGNVNCLTSYTVYKLYFV